jgi:hypothetical protein
MKNLMHSAFRSSSLRQRSSGPSRLSLILIVLSGLLLTSGMAPSASAQVASDNYIDESVAVSRLKLLADQFDTSISFSVVNGKIIASDKADKLIDAIVDAIENRTPARPAGRSRVAPADRRAAVRRGQSDQPADQEEQDREEASEGGVRLAASKYSRKTEQLKYEVRCLFFLLYEKDNSRVAAVNDFPAQFHYLNDIIDAADDFFAGRGNADLNSLSLQSGSAVSAGGLQDLESQLIYGITDFAISRAKEEILESHLKFIYDQMNSDSVVKALLPHTLEKMDAFIQDNSISMAKYGGLWKAAFQEDLRNLPVAMQDESLIRMILNRTDLPESVKFELTSVISGGDRLIYNLYLKKHPAVILSDMAPDYIDQDADNTPVFKKCVIMANVLASSLGHMENDKYELVNIRNLQLMDYVSWRVFVRLVYLRHKPALKTVFGPVSESFLTVSVSHTSKLTDAVKRTINLYGSYGSLLIDETGKGISLEDIRRLYDVQKQTLDNTMDYLRIFGSNIAIDRLVKNYDEICVPVLSGLSHIGEGLSNQQYGSVLDGTLSILKMVRSRSNCTTDQCKAFDNTIFYLTKYGSFMVNVLDSKSGSEVKEALDEIIPKGQYKLKNSKAFSSTVSLYPGAFYGRERILKYKETNGVVNRNSKTDSWSSSLGFYLPIGVDFNWGIDAMASKGKNMSIGIFLQAVDLGAVMNYRLNADSSESTNPQISLQQLISPGVSLMVHLPNSPVVVGAGINYTPALRKIHQADISYESNALRIGLFLAVDVTAIPLFFSKKDCKLAN